MTTSSANTSRTRRRWSAPTRFKLIVGTGRRLRQDGYQTGKPLPGPYQRLFDMVDDPGETRDLADDPRHQAVKDDLLRRMYLRMTTTRDGLEPVPPGLSDARGDPLVPGAAGPAGRPAIGASSVGFDPLDHPPPGTPRDHREIPGISVRIRSSTSRMVSSGTRAIRSALRARQSRLLT